MFPAAWVEPEVTVHDKVTELGNVVKLSKLLPLLTMLVCPLDHWKVKTKLVTHPPLTEICASASPVDPDPWISWPVHPVITRPD
jgi:hypothetical protein